MYTTTSLRRAALAMVGLLAALTLAACGGGSQVNTVGVADFAKQARAAGVTVVDVRTPAEYAAGHIAGAINIDLEGSTFTSDIAKLDKTKTYAVYCHSGRRSAVATSAMADAGFGNIYNLDGGIIAWEAAGGALVTS
ncbi:MAG: rhodanese-like domain-containing protein [Candidatus Nanopelagicales bacterium]